jgi:hypothetical protein
VHRTHKQQLLTMSTVLPLLIMVCFMPQCSFWLCFILMFLYLCKESWRIQWVLSVKGSLCSIDFVDWEKAWVGWFSAAVTTWGTTRTCHWVQLTIFLYRFHWWISSHLIPCGFYHPQSVKLLWSNNGSMFCCSVFDSSKDIYRMSCN